MQVASSVAEQARQDSTSGQLLCTAKIGAHLPADGSDTIYAAFALLCADIIEQHDLAENSQQKFNGQ